MTQRVQRIFRRDINKLLLSVITVNGVHESAIIDMHNPEKLDFLWRREGDWAEHLQALATAEDVQTWLEVQARFP